MQVCGRRRLCLGGAAAIALSLTPRPVRADGAAEYYKGRTVSFVVGSGPGGGNDSHARLLAPHLGAALGASVVVENRPGAGGLLALNQVYGAAPDGLTIMMANAAGAAIAQLLGQEGVHFDLRRLGWLAGLGGEDPVIMLGAKAPLRTLADARAAAAPVKWAASGRTSSQGVWIALATRALDIKSNLIVGYKGSNEAALAAMRGEADGIIVTASSAKIYAQDGLLLPVATLSAARSPLFPDLPTVFELVQLAADKAWWIEYCIRYSQVGRAIVAPPDLPAERRLALSNACRRMLEDPVVLAEAERAERPMAYRAPEAVKALALGLIDGVNAEQLMALRQLLAEHDG
jgi:tripartite-type tricarboxylate transporter receptor subunit TctC